MCKKIKLQAQEKKKGVNEKYEKLFDICIEYGRKYNNIDDIYEWSKQKLNEFKESLLNDLNEIDKIDADGFERFCNEINELINDLKMDFLKGIYELANKKLEIQKF